MSPTIRPLSARSVVLSLLLGAHPPELAARDLVAVADHFGISEPTLRVALTRMVANGDLERTGATYRLSERMLERQRRQDLALEQPRTAWTGDWEMVVVTAAGRSATDRAELRSGLTGLGLSELREGVWTRPANLDRPLPAGPTLTGFRARPEEPDALVARLWDLPAWDAAGHELLDAFRTASTGADRLAVAAALVRHLRTDPALPPELLPRDWVAEELRATYAAYQRELVETGIAVRISAS